MSSLQKLNMSSSRFFSTSLVLLLIIFPLFAHSVAGLDPLFHFCSSSGNFTSKSYYQKNLNKLLASLQFKSPPTGFGLNSVGQSANRANGLALCRGDLAATDCKTCVVEASSEIRKLCPYNKGAVLWYDNCLLKYSEVEFFGEIDDRNKFYMWNLRNVSDPLLFNRKVKELLSRLSEEAYSKPKLYASGEMELGGELKMKLYGLVQCTRDLSKVDCKKCLDDSISELPSCCDGKEGGRVVGGSCNIRYEIYPFVKA